VGKDGIQSSLKRFQVYTTEKLRIIREKKKNAELRIKDTGVGITAKNMDRIFEGFTHTRIQTQERLRNQELASRWFKSQCLRMVASLKSKVPNVLDLNSSNQFQNEG